MRYGRPDHSRKGCSCWAGLPLPWWRPRRPSAGWLVAGWAVLWAVGGSARPAPAPGQPVACPPVIRALAPKAAVHVQGMYQGQSPMAMGGGTADLPFQHPCLVEKFPAKWSVEVQHYEGEAVQLLQMQVDGYEQQVIQNEVGEVKRKQRGGTSGNPPRVERVGGGTVVISTQSRACPWGGVEDNRKQPPPIPVVRLVGVAHTGSTRITLRIQGDMTAEAALAAAQETFENLAKLTFQP